MQNQKERSAKPVRVTWFLTEGIPSAVVLDSVGDRYSIDASGKCFVSPAGSNRYLPCHGCLYPEVLLKLHFYRYMRKYLPVVALTVLSIVLVYLVMLQIDPNGAEVMAYSMEYVGHIISVTGALIVCVTFFVVIVSLGSQAVRVNTMEAYEDRKQLSAKNVRSSEKWDPVDLGNDILIYSTSEDESKEAFHSRMENALVLSSQSRWVVVIKYRFPMATIYTGKFEKFITFNRAMPTFEGDDWNDEDRVCQYNTPFTNESYEQYKEYVDRFIPLYKEWAPMQKCAVVEQDESGNVFRDMLKPVSSMIVMLLFCCASVFAQKSSQVQAYMGDAANEIVERGDIVFAFEKGRFPRKADGSKTWVEELKDVALYDDDKDAGVLTAISYTPTGGSTAIIKNSAPKRASAKKRQAGDNFETKAEQVFNPMDPNEYPTMDQPFMAPPDSAAIRGKFDRARHVINGWRQWTWYHVEPAWFFLIWLFSFLLPWWFMVMGFVRYVCKSAMEETSVSLYGVPYLGDFIYWIHRNTAAVLLIMTWVLAGILLGNAFLWMMYLNWPMWIIVPAWFFILWVAGKITKWFVPGPINPANSSTSEEFNSAVAPAHRKMRIGSGF